MTAPTVSRLTTLVVERLPDYAQAADAAHDYSLRRYLASLLDPQRVTVELVDAADPDTSVTGTSELANPAAAQRAWLPWLGWMVGLDVAAFGESEQRQAISDASSLRRRGSSASIIRATQRTLTGSKSCRVYPNLGGDDPYLITVVTLTDQTADEIATLEAAWTEKPAGMDLLLVSVDGSTYEELAAEFDDYDELADELTDYDDLAAWVPPAP